MNIFIGASLFSINVGLGVWNLTSGDVTAAPINFVAVAWIIFFELRAIREAIEEGRARRTCEGGPR